MTAYDEVRYPTHPRRISHPDHLAAMGHIFGLCPAPPASCRVLELACGDGGNLIPMALSLPGAAFLGLDLAETAIARGAARIGQLGLRNIQLCAADLLTSGRELGEFDYIIAHGLYSWVPEPVRERILALCDELLSPAGIAFVSYNCYPGRHIRNLFREMMQYHATHFPDPDTQVAQARGLMRFLGDVAEGDTYRALLREEADSIAKRAVGAIYHDDLAGINVPLLFTDFIRRAEAHGLQFLAEAEFASMHDTRNALKEMQAGVLEHEQYLDFVRCRSFRQTLLCRAGMSVDRPVRAARLRDLCFSSMARVTNPGEESAFESMSGRGIQTGHALAKSVVSTLIDAFPARLNLAELMRRVGTEDESAVLEILLGSFTGAVVEIHSVPAPCAAEAGERPIVSPLARLQAAEGIPMSTMTHIAVMIEDSMAQKLIGLLDGSRDRAALLRELGPPADAQSLEISLQSLAREGLLMA